MSNSIQTLQWIFKLLISKDTVMFSSNTEYSFVIKRTSIRDDYKVEVFSKPSRTLIESFSTPLLKNAILKIEVQYNQNI